MLEQFAKDVHLGLSLSNKKLPSKYFYDKKGDALFVQIMALPEYYLTRAEMEIFSEQTDAIIDAFELDESEHFELIELGAGDGSKTRKLLHALSQTKYKFDYIPIDISKNALDQLEQDLHSDLPDVSIIKKHGDYFSMLESLKDSHHPKVLLFLGSNIGNMSDDAASDFIYHLGASLSAGDKMLIGVDLIKSKEIILPAYNDEKGVTGEFNLNILRRINDELGADFDVDAFSHAPEYDEHEGVAKSHLKSLREQVVSIQATGKSYHFAHGEHIHTEISRKYNDKIMSDILSKTDFEIVAKLSDSHAYFADYILNLRRSSNQ